MAAGGDSGRAQDGLGWTPPGAQPPEPASLEQSTNGFAIASLVVGILWIFGVGSLLAIVFGFIARQRITESNGRERGARLATTGIVLGFLGVAVAIAFVVQAVYQEWQVFRGN